MEQNQLDQIIQEAQEAAYAEAERYFNNQLGGQDQFACGFAWCNIGTYNGKKVDGRTKIGKMLAKRGISRNYAGQIQWWNPSKFPCQNVDTLEVGARAAANVLKQHGFDAYCGSRLD